MYNTDRVTRSALEKDETLIQKIIEKILLNPDFIDKLVLAFDKRLEEQSSKTKVLEEKVESLENSVEALEQYSRCNSIRIFGVPEVPAEKVEETVIGLFSDKLKVRVPLEEIDICHRLREREGQHRPILVKFCRKSTKNLIYSVKKLLKGTRIVIREDLTSKRMLMIKELSKVLGYKSVFTVNGNVCVSVNNQIKKIRFLSDYKNVLNIIRGDQ